MGQAMSHLMRLTRAFRSDTRGAGAVEYGILVLMLVIALIGMSSMTNVSKSQSNTFNYISSKLAGE